MNFSPIDGYENRYLISDCGRVYSIRRDIFLKPMTHSLGYLMVRLSNRESSKLHYIHRLVAQSFIEYPDSDEQLEVNHIDGDKTNNVAQNLEWVTHKQNSIHAAQLRAQRDKLRTRQVTNKEVTAIIQRLDDGEPVTDIAQRYKYSESTIRNIRRKHLNISCGNI